MNSHKILTVGSMAFDTIQTPAGKADKVLGGSGNYFSIAASFFAPVSVVGVVGEDFPKSHLEWLSTRKIDTSGVQVVKGQTFHWVGAYDGNMNEAKTLSTALNVFEHFDPKLNESQMYSDHVFLANIDPVLQLSVLDQIKDPKLIAMDSMNFWITGKNEDLKKVLKRVDLLSINETEATLLTDEKNISKAAKIIFEMGPSVVIVKRGEYGAMLFTRDSLFIAPAFPVDTVVDPTGAGDSFAGALMGTLCKEGITKQNLRDSQSTLKKAILNGCVMASFTVQDFSIQRLMKLTPDEFKAREAQFLKMLQI